MQNKLTLFLSRNSRFIPLTVTALLAFLAYIVGAMLYPGMRDIQVFLNIFRNNTYLMISAVGMTFVILSGGIDLSVSGIVALTTVATAALIRAGWNPWLVFLLMLLMGAALGAVMGSFVAFLKVQPFIATLAGMWFARGMCFFISDDAISISHPVYTLLGQTKILIPGLAEIAWAQGRAAPYVTIPVLVSLLMVALAIYIAHFTRFGRNVYAIGGNEQSARLMGLPVNATRVMVYTFSGFCSGLAGIALSIFVLSGHGLYANGYEMDVIASVVMGGTMLTGGSGYLFGTPFGVLILGITQTLIQFNGSLSSWWTKIVIGILTLIFIGVQSLLVARKGGRKARELSPQARRQRWIYGGAATLVVGVLAVVLIINGGRLNSAVNTPEAERCALKPYRQDLAASLVEGGAVMVYERNGGPDCIDELYAIYPDGRITGNDGTENVEKQVTSDELNQVMTGILERGWFTDELYNTWHTPCGQCYGYYLTVVNNGEQKTVKGVDGGTDAPAVYWQIISLVKGLVPKFTAAP
ncbi:MAG TPA: sugar ABC transporter permease YjfF [Anaerolineaceae bacterium]|nr:sugar ABC transporter permease YjfF [Anaerolineaceae bacterium]HPN50326.1 sugar ABC transporter permease YjfF [Anaerolineaceae bacterium]